MFNLFKKKKPKLEKSQNEQYDPVNFIHSVKAFPIQYRQQKFSVDNWHKSDGDFVKKGEQLCEIRVNNEYGNGISAEIIADSDGVIEIFKHASNDYLNPAFLDEKEKVFTIYRNADKQKIMELKNKRFENIPLIKVDDFSGTKEIKWENVAGRNPFKLYDAKIYDSFIFSSEDNNLNKLIFTLNNIDNKDFIVFKYSTKDYKLTIGSKISFLFQNGEILEFEITTKPHKHTEHTHWGNIFETRVQLTTQELEILKTKGFSKWQIEFAKTGKKITGIIDSPDTQFSINKLTKEYQELVQREINDYQPLTDKLETPANSTLDNEECFVYLMIDLTNNFYKIGISSKPEYREKTLQSEKPTIEMLCKKRFPNRKIANSIEQALHQAYAEKRIRGEWFDLTDKEIQELKETLKS